MTYLTRFAMAMVPAAAAAWAAPAAAADLDQEDLQARLRTCARIASPYKPMDFAMLAGKHPGDAELNAAFEAQTTKARQEMAACQTRVANHYGANKEAMAEIAKLPRPEAVARQYQAGRASFEADPRSFLAPGFDKVDVGKMSRTLVKARDTKSLEQTCGTPPADRSYKMWAEYAPCMRSEMDRGRKGEAHNEFGYFMRTASLVQAWSRYACGHWTGANCLPEASYRRVADVLSSANTKIVEEADRVMVRREEEIKPYETQSLEQ